MINSLGKAVHKICIVRNPASEYIGCSNLHFTVEILHPYCLYTDMCVCTHAHTPTDHWRFKIKHRCKCLLNASIKQIKHWTSFACGLNTSANDYSGSWPCFLLRAQRSHIIKHIGSTWGSLLTSFFFLWRRKGLQANHFLFVPYSWVGWGWVVWFSHDSWSAL